MKNKIERKKNAPTLSTEVYASGLHYGFGNESTGFLKKFLESGQRQLYALQL